MEAGAINGIVAAVEDDLGGGVLSSAGCAAGGALDGAGSLVGGLRVDLKLAGELGVGNLPDLWVAGRLEHLPDHLVLAVPEERALLQFGPGRGAAKCHEDGLVSVVGHCQALRGLLGQLALTQNVGDVLDACTR